VSLNDWPGRAAAVSTRQWPTLEATAQRAANVDVLEGLILLGSFASGTPDELSDIDVIAVAAAGGFAEAWDARHRLSQGSLVSWDHFLKPEYQGHNWLTHELVKVDCTVVDPDSGSKELAEPFVVLVGPESVSERFPRISPETVRERARKIDEEQRRQVFDPDEMDPGELIDWKISELKSAVRRAMTQP
jgi:predicted nucleotidyltransferase